MKLRALLIEDDPDVSETINSVFSNFYEVEHVEHIIDATGFRRGTWKSGNYDIVILDLMLPGLTGFDVCEQLKSNPLTRPIPVLALTGYDTLQNEERIKKAGANGYMAKPFDVVKFKEEVDRLLKRFKGTSSDNKVRPD